MRKRSVLFTLVMLTLILMLLACESSLSPIPTSTRIPDTPTPTPTRIPNTPTSEPTATPKRQQISIEGPDCPNTFQENQQESFRREIEVPRHASLKLMVGSTPSIPCSWRAPEIEDQTVLNQSEHQSKWPAEGATPMPGAPGTEIWIFETIDQGESTVRLRCMCLDEQGSAEEESGVFTLHVTVK